jgi:pimeloyl-ACP methyl ester carboxylesterase
MVTKAGWHPASVVIPWGMSSEFDLQHVDLHGHDLAYRRAGDGETLLLIHGMAGSSRAWKGVMPALAERYDVLAPDLPGHGESSPPTGDYSLGNLAATLRDLLAVLDIERTTIVGQSLGGGIAMQLAYQHPELAARLVLVGSGGLGREVSWMIRALALPGAEYVAPVIFPSFVRDLGDRVSGAATRLGVRAPRLAEMWDAYATLTEPEHRAAFLRTVHAVIDPGGQAVSATDRLYLAAAVPTLIVWGDADPIIPVEHAYAAHDAMPGSRLEVFEHVGHFPHAEDPQRFTRVLLDFLATTTPAAGSRAADLVRRATAAG